MTSVQARTLNVVYRHGFKPTFQRGVTLASLRKLALRDRGVPLPAAAFTLSAVTDLRVL